MIFSVVFVLLATYASSVEISTNPSEIYFNDVLAAGYAEKTITIKSDSSKPLEVMISAPGSIKEWFMFEPEAASVSKGSPVEFKIITRPPPETHTGLYETYLIISTVSTGNELTTAVTTAKSLKTIIEVTDEEIIQAIVDDVFINAEKDKTIGISVKVQNKGNIGIIPFFKIEILNISEDNTLKHDYSNKKVIPPFSTDIIKLDIENNLPLGEYKAEITTFLSDNWIVGKRSFKFNIGESSQEEKVVLKEKPTSLSTDWTILFVWAGILVLTTWIISRNKRKER